MKKTIIVLLFALLVLLQFLNDNIRGQYEENLFPDNVIHMKKQDNSDHEKSQSYSKFKIDFNTSANQVKVVQTINWINKSSYPADSVFLCLPLNVFRNSDSESNRQMTTGYNFSSIEVNHNKRDLIYSFNETDSTIAAIETGESLNAGDSIQVSLEYTFHVSQGTPGFGYSKGEKFCLFADWHPYIILNKNGRWHKETFTRHFKPEAEPMNLIGEIVFDTDFFISSSAHLDKIKDDSISAYSFDQEKGNKVSFAFYEEVLSRSISAREQLPSIEIYLLDENERYSERIQNALINSLNFFNENIGPFPFGNLSLVNVPNNTLFGNHSYPSLITFYCDLISPESLLEPEYQIMRMLAKQYFQEALTLPDYRDKWIGEGIPTYLAGNIANKYYSKPYMHFKFAGYFPIFGLNLLSYNEIPIIYTLNDFPYDPGVKDISDYYRHIDSNPVINSKFDTSEEYFKANQSVKPAIILKSLESAIGEERVLSSIRKIYNTDLIQRQTENFINGFADKAAADFLTQSLQTSAYFDYKLDGITSHEDGVYEVNVSRSGSGTCPVTIYLYTESDTLSAQWDGIEKNYRCLFNTNYNVLAAEVDPGLATVMDINKANNSFTVQEQYWGSISIVVRAFFWFQNALMIFGSIG